MDELKPCPFCGDEADVSVVADDGGYSATVRCAGYIEHDCFAHMTYWAQKREWAVETAFKKWNRRADNG